MNSGQRGAQSVDVGRAEHDAVAGRDVDQVQVDPGRGDLAREVGEHARTVLDLDHYDLALAGDGDVVRDRERVLGGLRVLDEDVQLSALPAAEAGGGGHVHAGVTDRSGNSRECARGVLDVDDQVDCHRGAASA